MSSFRRTKVDANQKEIISHLRSHGVYVEPLSSVGKLPDLLIWHKGVTGFIECKVEGSKAVFTKPQISWIAATPAPIAICRTKEAALAFANAPVELGLTRKQKDRLSAMLIKSAKDRFTPTEVSAAIGEEK